MDRRKFLKVLATGASGLAFGNALKPNELQASAPGKQSDKELLGVLVDTTRCIGCRSCEAACADINGLPEPNLDDEQIFEKRRTTSETQYTVVNRYLKEDETEIFVKTQCMHCNYPGCASACLVKAMHKLEEGPVNWETNCIGCRYCMVACPFDIPKFEYNTPTPKIQKCTFCWETRVSKGEKPACVEACPADVMFFGTRKEVIEEAKSRIYQAPDDFYHHIYGEQEVGGTSWVYIAAVPFEQLGFRTDLGTTPYPKLSKGFLTNIAVIDLLVPTLLLGISYAAKNKKNDK
ncbi:MAG: 4Fe-4S dicluster domain-containing protein [Deltaproteobacteria bacterium]|nr:4Fe-4S dicluster domain-containing protein [Deltaproteobacteria bacterium]